MQGGKFIHLKKFFQEKRQRTKNTLEVKQNNAYLLSSWNVVSLVNIRYTTSKFGYLLKDRVSCELKSIYFVENRAQVWKSKKCEAFVSASAVNCPKLLQVFPFPTYGKTPYMATHLFVTQNMNFLWAISQNYSKKKKTAIFILLHLGPN